MEILIFEGGGIRHRRDGGCDLVFREDELEQAEEDTRIASIAESEMLALRDWLLRAYPLAAPQPSAPAEGDH